MVNGEQLVMAMAHVVHAEVDTGLVGGGAYHQVHHGLGHIYAVPPYLCRLVLSSSVDIFFVAVISMSTVYFIVSYRILPTDFSFILHLLIVVLPVLPTSVIVGGAALLNLIKVLGDSVLPPILIPCLP